MEAPHRHREMAGGRWARLSLAEQLGNVGSEVSRMLRWRGRDEQRMTSAFERALELLDLTLADPRWRDRLREIARGRELLCDAVAGGRDYGTTLEDLDRYYLAFAVAARRVTLAGPPASALGGECQDPLGRGSAERGRSRAHDAPPPAGLPEASSL